MPLIVMCGFPSSGKTTRVRELKSHLEKEHSRIVTIVDDDVAGMEKNLVYAESRNEKQVRGSLKSAVQRNLSKEHITILDSLNYIKGFRYELYCVSKEAQTTQITVFCETTREKAEQWNSERPVTEQYQPEIFSALVDRFEAPKESQRWDRPLVSIAPEDDTPLETIIDALLNRKAPPPNASTLPQPLSGTSFLYELDQTTASMVTLVMESQRSSVPGDTLALPPATDRLELRRPVTLAELHRHRRQFITYMKMHPVDDSKKIANMFVQYLNNTLQ